MSYQHFELICGCPETLSLGAQRETLSLSSALEEVFPAGTGLCVMQWNGIFIPLSYKYDISWSVVDALDMVEQLANTSQPREIQVSFPSNTFRTDWQVVADKEVVSIEPVWHSVLGGLAELLNERSPLCVPLAGFLSEWRHLFSVVLGAIDRSGLQARDIDGYARMKAMSQQRPR